MKKYLLFVTLPYAYSILRPLEDEIRRRGDEAAWFVEPDCPVALRDDEIRLRTVRDMIRSLFLLPVIIFRTFFPE